MQEQLPTGEQLVGEVTHYWSHLGVAGVHLTAPVDVGDTIHVHGHTTDFSQPLGSMELDHRRLVHGAPGMDVGVRVAEHAREHDQVFRVVARSEIGQGEGMM